MSNAIISTFQNEAEGLIWTTRECDCAQLESLQAGLGPLLLLFPHRIMALELVFLDAGSHAWICRLGVERYDPSEMLHISYQLEVLYGLDRAGVG